MAGRPRSRFDAHAAIHADRRTLRAVREYGEKHNLTLSEALSKLVHIGSCEAEFAIPAGQRTIVKGLDAPYEVRIGITSIERVNWFPDDTTYRDFRS